MSTFYFIYSIFSCIIFLFPAHANADVYKLFLGDCEKSESIYFKNFKYRRASEVICTEMPAVLKVYVLLDCKLSFRCFDCVAAWSVNCGCNITPARGTKNFAIEILYSGNRRKFTSMFNCALLAHPCASVAKGRMKF